MMPIYQTAQYQVRTEAVDRVRAAIAEFVAYVADNEPGSRLYAAWQEVEDPTKFVHLFIFDDAAAHEAHGRSAAVKKFESVYTPELTAGPASSPTTRVSRATCPTARDAARTHRGAAG
jgi:quinol monooxygenase YgiN